MSRWERHESRDRVWSNWHRCACSDRITMVDIDCLEYCGVKRCWQPLYLIESARDVGQTFKPTSAMTGLARKADVPAAILLWKPSESLLSEEPPHCPCMRDQRVYGGCDHGVAAFRARRVHPESGKWEHVSAEQVARWINGIHEAHRETHHRRIGAA